LPYHLQNTIKVGTILNLPPGSSHAKASGTVALCLACRLHHFFDIQKLLCTDIAFVVSALGAVGTILGTASGLDAEQGAQLDFVRIVVAAMLQLSLKEQVGDGRIMDGSNFLVGPIVANKILGVSILAV